MIELLSRRAIRPKTAQLYLYWLRKAQRYCVEHGLALDELDDEGLFAYASSLHQSRGILHQARAAVRHYWAGTGRTDPPRLKVVELLGRGGREPGDGLAARERLSVERPGGRRVWGAPDGVPWWLRDGLRSRQLARRTTSAYIDHLKRCALWCAERGTTIDTISAVELETWADTLPRTRSTLMALRSSLVHYFALSGRPDPPTYVIRVPRRKRMISKALSEEEARVLEHAAVDRRDRKGLAVIVGLYLGLRRFEIAKLRWADFGDGWVTLVGKGDLEASLPVHQVVQDYMALIPRQGEYLFPGRWGGPANPTTIWGWVRDVAVEAGLEQVPTHVLRHTALAAGNDVTGDLRAVQDFARHADPNTTAGYTRSTRRRLEQVAQAIAEAYRPPAEAIDHGPDSDGPTLPFAQLIATVEGAHAVAPWRELSTVLGNRKGWRLVGCMEGEAIVRFEHSPLLSASVIAYTSERPPVFDLSLVVGPDVEDVDTWTFESAEELGRLVESFEEGIEPLMAPAHSSRIDA